MAPPRPSRALVRTFALTWVAYAAYYLTRKNFSVAKRTLERTLGIDRATLAAIDTTYLAAYSLGQIVWGLVADRVGARRVLVAGLLATALCSVGFGLSSSAALLALWFGLNGLAQSTGWPTTVKLMTGCTPPARRGAIMGVWATNYQIGSMVANPAAAALLGWLGWRAAFFGPAAMVAVVALAVWLFLPADEATGVPRAGDHDARSRERSDERRRVLSTPLVWALGAAYFFLKLTRYVLLFWLPYYMESPDGLAYPTRLAATVPLAFEAGGALGAVVVGFASDRWLRGERLGVSIACLVGLAGALPLYAHLAPHGVLPNALGLALVGFCLFGPDTLLSGAAAQDLGGPTAAATAAGLINGLGSIGAIAQGPLSSAVSLRWGWGAVFRLLSVGTGLAIAVLLPFSIARRRERAARPPR